ncbi:hypothetical protein ACNOYE_26545 [Nannocystaceae bacterium ST9]
MTNAIAPLVLIANLAVAASMLVGCAPEGMTSLDSSESDTGEGNDGDSDSDSSEGDTESDGGGPLCIADECIDGVADSILHAQTPSGGSPSLGLAPGDPLRVFGVDHYCWDDCWDDWFVVRDLANAELVAAGFGHPFPTDELLLEFGETPQSWTAPLTIDSGDFGLCPPYDSGCGTNTFKQRGALELDDGEAVARVLDHGVGWAPRGYHVDLPRWLLGDADCQFMLWAGRAYVHRSDCGEDCPTPHFADTCEPNVEIPPEAADFVEFSVIGFVHERERSDGYDALCVVLSVEPDGPSAANVMLDCVFSDPLE